MVLLFALCSPDMVVVALVATAADAPGLVEAGECVSCLCEAGDDGGDEGACC